MLAQHGRPCNEVRPGWSSARPCPIPQVSFRKTMRGLFICPGFGLFLCTVTGAPPKGHVAEYAAGPCFVAWESEHTIEACFWLPRILTVRLASAGISPSVTSADTSEPEPVRRQTSWLLSTGSLAHRVCITLHTAPVWTGNGMQRRARRASQGVSEVTGHGQVTILSCFVPTGCKLSLHSVRVPVCPTRSNLGRALRVC